MDASPLELAAMGIAPPLPQSPFSGVQTCRLRRHYRGATIAVVGLHLVLPHGEYKAEVMCAGTL